MYFTIRALLCFAFVYNYYYYSIQVKKICISVKTKSQRLKSLRGGSQACYFIFIFCLPIVPPVRFVVIVIQKIESKRTHRLSEFTDRGKIEFNILLLLLQSPAQVCPACMFMVQSKESTHQQCFYYAYLYEDPHPRRNHTTHDQDVHHYSTK